MKFLDVVTSTTTVATHSEMKVESPEMTRSSLHQPPVMSKNVALESRSNWRYRARCKFFGVEIFFAPDDETPGERARRERVARDTCAVCPVQEICRDHALARREQHGVWGGLTESERRK